MRTTVYWGLYWGPLILGKYHVAGLLHPSHAGWTAGRSNASLLPCWSNQPCTTASGKLLSVACSPIDDAEPALSPYPI